MTSLRTALRRRLDPDSENGVSLVELIVTMMVTGIVLTIVAAMFVNVAKVTADANGTNTRSSVAANVMNEMSKVIRVAANNATASSEDPDPAIVAGTASTLTVYSYVDTSPTAPAPTKVTFRVDANGNVWEDRVAGAASGSYWTFTGTSTSRNLGAPITATTLFTYLDQGGQTVVPGGTGLTLAQRNSVASIKVTVTIANTPTLGSDPIVIINTVGMPNLLLTGTDN
ncbi:MAG: prepilin-type N-terminal cleavage/methylation domain-containing protein [Salinibacterium sp.]|nr:prepilin-type N-terminal cleavage/methylation domain-containing protein [Salinibacterium sp.]